MIERRKDGRFIVDFRTEFKNGLLFMYEVIKDQSISIENIERDGVATVLNISKSGCYIYCTANFAKKTNLLLTIVPMKFPTDQILITAKIIRQVPDNREGYYYAIQFSECSIDSQKKLTKFLDTLSVKERQFG